MTAHGLRQLRAAVEKMERIHAAGKADPKHSGGNGVLGGFERRMMMAKAALARGDTA